MATDFDNQKCSGSVFCFLLIVCPWSCQSQLRRNWNKICLQMSWARSMDWCDGASFVKSDFYYTTHHFVRSVNSLVGGGHLMGNANTLSDPTRCSCDLQLSSFVNDRRQRIFDAHNWMTCDKNVCSPLLFSTLFVPSSVVSPCHLLQPAHSFTVIALKLKKIALSAECLTLYSSGQVRCPIWK